MNTSKETVIDCSISNDKREYLFNFDDTFEIHDDMEVLKRMGLGFGLERGQVNLQVYNRPLFYHSGKWQILKGIQTDEKLLMDENA